jgi:uncharacterized membrane protein YdjX (TVP38/TMEM64 family)
VNPDVIPILLTAFAVFCLGRALSRDRMRRAVVRHGQASRRDRQLARLLAQFENPSHN